MEIDQHETHLVNLAAKIFAGQTVGEFVGGADQKDDCREQWKGREPVEAGNVLPQVTPIQGRYSRRQENERSGKHQKMRREKAPRPPNQTLHEVVRVENLDPEIQRAAANPPAARHSVSFCGRFRFQQTVLVQNLDEGTQRFRGKRRTKLLFCPLAHHFKRRLPVQLLGDELFDRPKAKEIAGDRVFDD